LTAEDRAKYIESIIETEKTRQLNGGAQPISDFDKTRLSANIGILIYEGLAANARATTDLTAALGKASDDLRAASRDSSNTARQLKNYTVVLAFATGLLVFTSFWQAYEAHQTNKHGTQDQPASRTNPPAPALQPQASSPSQPTRPAKQTPQTKPAPPNNHK
jgi:hypothetical protein